MTLRKKSKIKIAYEDSQKIKTEEKIIDWYWLIKNCRPKAKTI